LKDEGRRRREMVETHAMKEMKKTVEGRGHVLLHPGLHNVIN
jgi:hypothetical protein